jgi:ferredoxin
MKIKFVPIDVVVEAGPEKSLLQIAHENGIQIRSICKGVPSCAECRVHIAEGDHHIPPPTKAEMSLIGTSYYLDSRRLSCQVRCFGDVTVDIKEQLDAKDGASKKLRGFKSKTASASESHAVQGTLVLEEKVEDLNKEASKSHQAEQRPQEPRHHDKQVDRSNDRQNDRQKDHRQGDQRNNDRQQDRKRRR